MSPRAFAQSRAIDKMVCELIAVIAAFTISKRVEGYFKLSKASKTRGNPNAGCGSPRAADSPRTKIRTTLVALACEIENGYGQRAISRPKKRQPNRLFCTNI